MNIYDIINRARSLKEEYRLDSVTPERLGALHEDTLKYINEYQLLASSPAIHKTYASISAMQSSSSPKSDLTGKPLKAGQLVVIVPADPSDSTAGDVYRYDGPSGNTSKWTFVAKIGAVPADAELSATSTNPPQNQAVTAKLTELESKTNEIPHPEFVENCPYIVELYINENGKNLDVSTVHLTYSENHFIRFSNTAKDTFTAKTKLDADGFYNGIIEIVSENGGVNCGYIIVDWTQMHEGKTVVKPILEPAYNLDYSPSIKGKLLNEALESKLESKLESVGSSLSLIPHPTFIEGCPYIVEVYINQLGKEKDVARVHIVYGRKYISFSNTEGDKFVAETKEIDNHDSLMSIVDFYDHTTIYGYIVVDWNSFNVEIETVVRPFFDSVYDINLSPSIKLILEPNAREGIDYGDRKPLEVCSATIDNAERIWFQFPKGKKPSHVDTIKYIAYTGLVGFTKVTYDKENNKILNSEFIMSSDNSEDANGKIVTLSVDVHLDENQYVGITGAFRYLNDVENKYGFTSLNFAVADNSLGYVGDQILGYEALNSNSLEAKIIDSQSEINDLSASVFLGDKKPLELCTISVSNTGSIWFQYPIKRIGKIDTINFLSKTGTTNFYVVTYDSESNFINYELLISVVNSAFENNTIKTIKVNVELNNNQFIGVNGDFRFISNYAIYGLGYYSRNVNLDTSVVSDMSNQILGFEALNMDGSESQIQLIKDYLYKPEKWAVLHKDRLTETKDYITGSQSFGNFGMVVNGLLVVNKFYSLSQRYAKFICKFGSNTVARFGTVLSNSWNTYFDVDIANKTIRCKSLESKTSYLLRAGDVISITICKNYNVQSCEVCNMTLGKKEVFEWQFNGQGGVGTGAIGTKVDTGMQYDYYGVTLMSGSQYEIQDLIIGSAKCDLVIYGDSITEGEAYYPANMLNTHWVQLIINKLKGNAVASGRSGTAMAALMERIVNEIPFIKPKYVMVTIGTNGGNTVSGLSNMVEYIQSQGAECILNHIPANINAGGVSNHINTNNVIDEVRAKYGLKGADFDLATAINRNPSEGVNQDMMWKEDYGGSTGTVYHHPNDLGSMAMMEQVEIDIPFIFEL